MVESLSLEMLGTQCHALVHCQKLDSMLSRDLLHPDSVIFPQQTATLGAVELQGLCHVAPSAIILGSS